MTETSVKRAITAEIVIGGHEYITAHRLAIALGVTVRTLARWDAAGIGPPKIKIGKRVFFDTAKLPEWLEDREVRPVSALCGSRED
jgi:hypothetical protein